ncbi:MAG: hypothetical protein WDZ41_02435 [Candidatus Babeliales bacterium]
MSYLKQKGIDMRQHQFQGLLFLIGGIILLVLSAGELLARVILMLIALGMINYGLRLRGEPPLIMFINQIRNRFWY